MLTYIQNRLLRLIPVLLVVTFITFSLMYLASGDPAQKKLVAQGIAPTEEMLDATRENMGLNDPFLVRYARWLGGFLQGDLGESYAKGLPVSHLMWKAMGKTSMVAVSALVISLAVSIPLGIWTAVKRNTAADYLFSVLYLSGQCHPLFSGSSFADLSFLHTSEMAARAGEKQFSGACPAHGCPGAADNG